MDAAAEQEKTTKRRQIPPEIAEIILMHLPIKSLHRFTRISKSWRSLISEPNFMKKRAAVRDSRRLLMSPHHRARNNPVLADVSSCPLSSISSDSAAVEDATPIIFPVEGKPILRASCSEFLCVEINDSLYLCNPSTNIYKKLPDSSLPSDVGNLWPRILGLGYDSINDDYKIFRRELSSSTFQRKSELYSLKSDSWNMIDYSPLLGAYVLPREIVFVVGAFHLWTNYPSNTIISFDLATEKYGNVAPPPPEELRGEMEVSALRGKLCAHSCRSDGFEFHFVMWVMEEYGIEKSWTKKFDIKNVDGIPLNPDYGRMFSHYTPIQVRPLYLFDNGELLFLVCTYETNLALFMYKGDETRPWRMICGGISNDFVYDESLLSPLKFVKLNVASQDTR